MRRRPDRREAMLATILCVAALSLLNAYYLPFVWRWSPAWFWVADACHFVLVPLACWFWLLRPAGITCADAGLAWQRDPHAIGAIGTGAMVLMGGLLVGLTWPVFVVSSWTAWKTADFSFLRAAMPSGFAARAPVAIYLSASAALVEEVVFRALPWLYLQQALARRWRLPVYLLATTVLFAWCHSEQGVGGVVAAGWFGLVAAALYVRLRSLWPLVAGHFAVDLLAFGPW